jgi:hypothetical protein
VSSLGNASTPLPRPPCSAGRQWSGHPGHRRGAGGLRARRGVGDRGEPDDLAAVVDPLGLGGLGPGHVDLDEPTPREQEAARGLGGQVDVGADDLTAVVEVKRGGVGVLQTGWGTTGLNRPRSSRNPAGGLLALGAWLGLALSRLMPGAWTSIGVGGEAAAVVTVRAVATAAPATARRSRRARLVGAVIRTGPIRNGATRSNRVSSSLPLAGRWRGTRRRGTVQGR